MVEHDFSKFIEELKLALKLPLPGSSAHDMLAPEHRKSLLQHVNVSEARLSSVLILLFPDNNGKPNIVFTKRKVYIGVHSGQISFPGGKAEKTDKDLFDTALRETEEEIGIKRDDIKIIGVLSELYVPPSNFIIFPVIGITSYSPAFHPEEKEVDEVFTVPFDYFMSNSSLSSHIVKLQEMETIQVPGFKINNNLLWGATAMIMSELIVVAKNTATYQTI